MKIVIHNAQISSCIGGTERAIFMQIESLLRINPSLKITLITRKTKNETFLFKKIKKLQSKRFKIISFDTSRIKVEIKEDANSANKWHMESMQLGLISGDYYLRNDFDFILIHFSTDLMFLPRKTKKILSIHGTPNKFSLIDDNCLRLADMIVYTTKNIKNKIEKMYPVTKSIKSKVVYLGTKTNSDRLPLQRKIDILFVGRLIKIKGIDFLIRAIHRLNNQHLKVSVIGKGPEGKNLRKLVNKLGLRRNITFYSNISDEKLKKFYKNSKIVVFPSYEKEGIILAMLEAASFGCGLVVSDCCGMPEFIKNNFNGLLFKPKDVGDLSKKISCLLDNPKMREKMGRNAQLKVNNFWNGLSKTKEFYEFFSGGEK